MHRQSADAHRAGLQRPLDVITLEMIVRPRRLTIGEGPVAQCITIRERWHVIPGFEHEDVAVPAAARQSLGDHRRRDAGADDADVGLDDASHHAPCSGSGRRLARAKGRQLSRPIATP